MEIESEIEEIIASRNDFIEDLVGGDACVEWREKSREKAERGGRVSMKEREELGEEGDKKAHYLHKLKLSHLVRKVSNDA